jgi:hypothetical protein
MSALVDRTPLDFVTGANLLLDHNNFRYGQEIARGGYGAVFDAIRVSDGKHFAVKFFGYTRNLPEWLWVRKEIMVLDSMKNFPGVVSLIGVIMDTPSGLVAGKSSRFRVSFPAIVMVS